MNIESISWLALLVVFLVIELATLGLTTIWFAGGALAAFFASMFSANLPIQIILFGAVSIVLLLFTRPWAVRYVNKDRIKTNAEGLIGKTAVVTEEIQNLAGTGQVLVGGQEWTARAQEEAQTIPEGAKVRILSISGVKLIVDKL